MLSRAVWTVVLALLAWIPVGRGNAWSMRGSLDDRAIVAISALDVAGESPARIASAADVRITRTSSRRPEAPRTIVDAVDAVRRPSARAALRGASELRQQRRLWRAFREKRLSFPHDAIAPPSSQS